jgi:hypothetical protein
VCPRGQVKSDQHRLLTWAYPRSTRAVCPPTDELGWSRPSASRTCSQTDPDRACNRHTEWAQAPEPSEPASRVGRRRASACRTACRVRSPHRFPRRRSHRLGPTGSRRPEPNRCPGLSVATRLHSGAWVENQRRVLTLTRWPMLDRTVTSGFRFGTGIERIGIGSIPSRCLDALTRPLTWS